MLGLLAPIGLAVLFALARGGSLNGWTRLRVRWWALVVVGLGAQALVYSPLGAMMPWAAEVSPWVFAVSLALVLLALVRNALHYARLKVRTAWLLAALGVGLNLLVVAANGGAMPRLEAANPDHKVLSSKDAPTNVAPLTTQSRLAFLGDVISQPDWLPMANLVSVGDLLLSLGISLCAFQVTIAVPAARGLASLRHRSSYSASGSRT